MTKPIIVVNFKAYSKAVGDDAVKLAKVHQEVARKTRAKIMVAVQAADIYRVSNAVKIDVLSQHVDANEPGAYTGSVLAENIKENGASGSLLNHAEKRMSIREVRDAIFRCRKLGLYNVVCVPTISNALTVARFKPRYIAYEVPELIGTGRPISRVRPLNVRIFAKAMKSKGVTPLCGAGISNGEDVRIAMELGCKGVLLASAVTTSKHPDKVLMELIG